MAISEMASNIEAERPTKLRQNTLSLGHVVASTLANIAPAMSFFFGFAVIVRGAGLASILTILTAMVVILFLTNTIAEFSRFTPSAGSFVTFTGKAFGPSIAAAASLFVTFGYIVAGSTVVSIAGVWVADTINTFWHISLNWAVLTILISLVVGWLLVRGVAVSTLWAGIFFYFEAGLLAVGAILMMVAHPDYLTLEPFRVSNLTGGLAGLSAGFPLAVYLFIGWENSASLAEETERPRRNIPRALVVGTLAIGLFYIFLAYATAVGFKMDAGALGDSQIPFIDALSASAPALLILAYVAGVTSIVSSLIACINSTARIVFNSGREKLLPEFLGSIHRRYHTPHIAIWACIIIALGLTLTFGLLGVAPLDYFGFAATLGTIPIILTYLLANLALPVYIMRFHRSDLNVVRHLILPIVGSAVMLLPLWGLVQLGQPWPLNTFPWIALAVLFLSLIYGIVIDRSSPELARRIGGYVADQ
jgi:amino acid transporter